MQNSITDNMTVPLYPVQQPSASSFTFLAMEVGPYQALRL